MARSVDMTGRRIGMLTVIRRVQRPDPHVHWLCICDCGKETVACGRNLRTKGQFSCGCTHLGARTHGQTETSTYRIWIDMRRRCSDEKRPQYKDYGGRGITVCERWKSFENFLSDMGHRPDGYSIERVDNDGNYEPSNCCWLPLEKQSRNRRCVHHLTVNGESFPMTEAARRSGLNPTTVHYRIKAGWPVERLLEPV